MFGFIAALGFVLEFDFLKLLVTLVLKGAIEIKYFIIIIIIYYNCYSSHIQPLWIITGDPQELRCVSESNLRQNEKQHFLWDILFSESETANWFQEQTLKLSLHPAILLCHRGVRCPARFSLFTLRVVIHVNYPMTGCDYPLRFLLYVFAPPPPSGWTGFLVILWVRWPDVTDMQRRIV